MEIEKQGAFWCISRVTGPRHNSLRLAFTSQASPEVLLEALPPQGGCEHEALDANKILAAVLEGVELANDKFGTSYCVARAQFVINDTPPEHMYGALAYEIVKSLVNNPGAGCK